MRPSFPALVALLCLGSMVIFLLRTSDRTAVDSISRVVAPKPANDVSSTDVDGLSEPGLQAASAPSTRTAVSPERVDAAHGVIASELEATEVVSPVHAGVMGVVTDSGGAPQAGVTVELQSVELKTLVRRFDDLSKNGRGTRTVETDASGGFLFDEAKTSAGGTLRFGANRLANGAIEQAIDVAAAWQILTLPDPVSAQGTWTIEVVDQNGAPVLGELTELSLEGGAGRVPSGTEDIFRTGLRVSQVAVPGDPGARLPQIVSKPGQFFVSSLAQGTWMGMVRTESALGVQVTSPEILAPSEEAPLGSLHVVSKITVEVLHDAITETSEPENHQDGTPWIHTGAAMADWLPEDLLQVGEWDRDRYFARTFRFGMGPLRAAELTIDMEATSGASGNDGIYMESLSGREFAWKARVASTTRQRWVSGARETVTLDLSRLTAKDGSRVDLRSLMEDGMLDVVIQDDTIVHSARLRVLR